MFTMLKLIIIIKKNVKAEELFSPHHAVRGWQSRMAQKKEGSFHKDENVEEKLISLHGKNLFRGE